jgi:hypothetical protein
MARDPLAHLDGWDYLKDGLIFSALISTFPRHPAKVIPEPDRSTSFSFALSLAAGHKNVNKEMKTAMLQLFEGLGTLHLIRRRR